MSKTLKKKNKSKIWKSYQSQNLTKIITKILENEGKYAVKKEDNSRSNDEEAILE